MVCSFFGHRDVADTVGERVFSCIETLFLEKKVTLFYVGTHGSFDRIVLCELRKAKKKYPELQYAVVLSYLNRQGTKQYDEKETLYPEGLERVPRRAAIVARNRWMIDHSGIVVVYYRYVGNTKALAEYAESLGKSVINLANDSDK